MKIKDVNKAVRRKCQSYKQKLTFAKITPEINTISRRVPVTTAFASDAMGSLEKYGFGRRPNFSNFDSEEEEKDLNKYSSCCSSKKCPDSDIVNNGDEETLSMDFFKNTSLHGLKYIGQQKQHFVERLFWSMAFIIGLIVAYYMISDVWGKYSNNSVIITFAPFDTKIEEIPFPAITICSMNMVLKSKALQFMEESKGSSRQEGVRAAREKLYYLNHVCSSSSKSFSKAFNYSANRGKIDQWSLQVTNKNENNYDGGKEDLWQFFLEASPLCNEMILRCTWQEEIQNCSDLFTEIETDYGKCCTFNMAPPSILHRFNSTSTPDNAWWNWDGESLLKKPKIEENHENKVPLPQGENDKDENGSPKRQKVPGKSFGLSVLLDPGLENYFCSSSDSVGFRIGTHLPINVPNIGDLGSALKPNSEIFVNVRPEIIIGDKEAIKGFSKEHRQCYFNEEHKLGYYNYYSSSNCIDECIANLTYQECNCRRHYQPGDNVDLCGPKQFHCASNIKKKFVGNYKTQCKMCVSTCSEIVYHTETTYTTMQSPEILWKDNFGRLAPWAYKNVSIVHIYFGEGTTNAKLRKELYGTVDLIANFGGLMGLCLGFSGLSLIEVVYFLTIRAWFRSRRRRRQEIKKKNATNNCWNNGIRRSDTTTELLNNEIACIPLYKSPEVGFQKIYKGKKRSQQLNHILYTVAFSHNSENN